MMTFPDHCPGCKRELEYYGTETSGHSEALYTVNGKMVCGDCARRSRWAGKELHRLEAERREVKG